MFGTKGKKNVLYARDLDGQIFYKMSKSNQDMKHLCSESHYLEYKENELIYDNGEHYISFVKPNNIILCFHYGDQLTEIVFDSKDKRFKNVSREVIHRKAFIWDEYGSKVVITGGNYSLRELDTIKRIVELSSRKNLLICIHSDYPDRNMLSISRHLMKLGFTESLDCWNEIKYNILKSI